MIGFTGLGNMFRLMLRRATSKYPLAQFTASANTRDLQILAALMQEGKLKPHIERTYPYTQLPDALGYIEAMRTRGKVVMMWEETPK